jgi:D-amino-acid oxidase
MQQKVLVVGAGVSGLTTAVELLSAGHEVTVVFDKEPDRTVSAVAGALWYLPRGELMTPRAVEWAAISYEVFTDLAKRNAGVGMRSCLELLRSERDLSTLESVLPGFRMAEQSDLVAGASAGFWSGPLPVISMDLYLGWLVRRVRLGARFIQRNFVYITEVVEVAKEFGFDAIVNATGMGSRELVRDKGLTPIKGQIIRVAPFGLEHAILDEDHPGGVVYMLPRLNDVVCGGIREINDESTEPDAEAEKAILERCAQLHPGVTKARLIDSAAGVRPGRGSVRLEMVDVLGMRVVHNYGHGGNGVTLSWGCAREVASLLR